MVYQATVTREDNSEEKTYVGLTEGVFKNNNNNNNFISIAVYTKALCRLTIKIENYTKEKSNLNTLKKKKTNTQIINYK